MTRFSALPFVLCFAATSANALTAEEIQAYKKSKYEYSKALDEQKVTDPAKKKQLFEATVGKTLDEFGRKRRLEEVEFLSRIREKKASPSVTRTAGRPAAAQAGARVNSPPAADSAPSAPAVVLDGTNIPREMEFSGAAPKAKAGAAPSAAEALKAKLEAIKKKRGK